MGDPTLVTVVANPASNRGRAGRRLPGLVTRLAAGLPQHRLDIHSTASYDHARDLCRAAVAEPDSILCLLGGDGMMHLGVDAAAGTEVALGLLPAGTGNDMCRGWSIPVDGPQRALDLVLAGRTRRLDVLAVTTGAGTSRVGSVVATGFDSRVNQRANAMSWPRGNLRYAVSAIAELARFAPIDYRLRIEHPDGHVEHREQPAMLVAIGTGAYFGGGMRICPDADPADGLLDITIVHPVSRPMLLALLPTMFTGHFVHHPAVERLRARAVDIDADGLVAMGDGEELGPGPVRIDLEPSAVTVFSSG